MIPYGAVSYLHSCRTSCHSMKYSKSYSDDNTSALFYFFSNFSNS